MARASCPDCGGASGLWRSIRTAAKHPGCGGHSARGTYCCGAIRPIAARALAAMARKLVDGRRIVAAMILGMSTETFTLLHVAISLIAIACGVAVTIGLLRARRMPGWSGAFLI